MTDPERDDFGEPEDGDGSGDGLFGSWGDGSGCGAWLGRVNGGGTGFGEVSEASWPPPEVNA